METRKENFTTWLNDELESRMNRNSAYSLRAFARDLKLDVAQLSHVLKGKKGLSLEKGKVVASSLGLSASDQEYFLLLLKQEHSRSISERETAKKEIKEKDIAEVQVLTNDIYNLISDLHNTSILEYLRHPKATQATAAIAKAFGLTPLQVKASLARLERIGMIKKEKNRWMVCQVPYTTQTQATTSAIRNHHSQVLKKAEQAIFFDPQDEREFSSTELIIDQAELPEMKKFLRNSWKEFCNQFAKNQSGTAVYEFSYQLFKLAKIESETKETEQ